MKRKGLMQNFEEVALQRIKSCKIENSKYLDLSYLCLARLPNELFELEQLVWLDLKGNYIMEIPEEIQNLKHLWDLDISYNSLGVRGIKALQHLNTLTSLNYSGNPFITKLPPEIINRPFWELIDYLIYLDQGQVSLLHECKLIFVGYGEVGKTTIMRKIIEPGFKVMVGEEETTHGINIEKWTLHTSEQRGSDNVQQKHYYSDDDQDDSDENTDDGDGNGDIYYNEQERDDNVEIAVNLWDFGGQEIYHATHQFFLTKRSVYVFVWEARKEEDYFQFEYWLNIIKYLSNQSPVLIVMNKIDVREKNIDEYTLKNKFPNIVSFHKISCVNNSGFYLFKRKLEETINSLDHVHDEMPKSWKNIRALLESREEDYISITEYYKICLSYILDIKQADYLSEYYHDLGVFVHFSKDSILRKTVILNPEWATNAVYKLIDEKSIVRKAGRFNFSELEKVWDPQKYPVDKHLELVRLMEKFELVFNLNGTTDYIIPELLASQRPAFDFSIFSNPALQVEFRYEFMPAGILSRLICRLHHLIPKKLYWKDGVVIKYEKSDAIIFSERINKKIIIKIDGESASELLSILRHELVIIHQSLNLNRGKDYTDMVPCICHDCKKSMIPEFYSYDVLKNLKSKGRATIICNRSAEDVNIDFLLSGYEIVTRENDLLYYILSACSKLQGHHMIVDRKEDSRNEFIANILEARFTTKDQTRWGRSPSGKSEGELDIKIENENKIALSIFEAFTLKIFNKGVIESHLKKIFDYDANGLKENYIVIYSEAENFVGIWTKYLTFINEIDFKYKLHTNPKDLSERYGYGVEIKVAVTYHIRNEERIKLYHLMLNLNFKSSS